MTHTMTIAPLDADTYAKLADRTNLHGPDGYMKVQERMADPQFARLMHAAMGMVTESAEFMDALKKHAIYGKPIDEVNLKEELGDKLWYVALAVNTLNTTFGLIMEQNIRKLKKRFPDNFTEEAALTRNLEAERAELERPQFVVNQRVYIRKRDLFGIIEKIDGDHAFIKFEWPYDTKLAAQPEPLVNLMNEHDAPQRG